MEKVLSVAAVLLMLPVGAFACDPVSVGTYDMVINYDGVGDLDIRTDSFVHVSGSELTLAGDNSNWRGYADYTEIFCVSRSGVGNGAQRYEFYNLSDRITKETHLDVDVMGFITYTANWGAMDSKDNYRIQEDDKQKAQYALWYYLGVYDSCMYQDAFYELKLQYLNYVNAGNEVDTSGWMVAMNGAIDSGYQDYLVKASPVPVPSTMLLLGSALVGLTAAGRRKKQ